MAPTALTQALQQQTQQQLALAQQAASAAAPAAGAASANRILFLVVVSGADLDCLEDPKPTGPRYTRDSLRNLLQLLGCKPRLAFKVMQAVFTAVDQAVTTARQQRISRKTFQVHPHRNGKVYVSLTRADFMTLVSTCAAQYSYKISPSSEELKVACSLRERRRCVVVLLCGTSGSGKSTLASILASRLGITTVVSTDSIRHMLRSFISRESSPLLWASTYQAGEHVGDSSKLQETSSEAERALYGYKAQCGLLSEHLETLIEGCEARMQSLICEGVHLNISTVVKLMARHPSVLPFLVYIPSESRHIERMAVRAKYMTLDPNKNRYVRYMGNIRLIQEYLVRKADKYAVPRVDNSNVDRSVGIIHLTVMSCLRRMARGEPVLDPSTGRTSMLAAEYAAVLDHLQGEKDRLAAATAAAAVTAAAGAVDVSSLSSSQPSVLQQPCGDAAGGSGASAEAGSLSSSWGPPGLLQQPQGHLDMAGPSASSAAAAGSMQPEVGGAGSSAPVPGSANGCAAPCSQAPAMSQDRSAAAAGAGSAGGRAAGIGVRLQPHTHVLRQSPAAAAQAVAAAAAALQSAPVNVVSKGGSSSAGWPECSAEDAAGSAAAQPRPVSISMAAVRPASDPQQQPGLAVDVTSGPTAGRQAAAAAASTSASQLPLTAAEQQGVLIKPGSLETEQQQQQHVPQVDSSQPLHGSSAQQPSEQLHRSSSGDEDLRGSQHSTAGGPAAGYGSHRSSREIKQQEQQQEQEQEQQHWRAGVQQQQQQQQSQQQPQQQQHQQPHDQQDGVASRAPAHSTEDVDDLVSSGEELDGLGQLGSSDNEGERFLQEYGSVYESTTCDEHDDYDESGGLRAWNAGMATALWPSYSHVYAPGAAAAAAAGSGSGAPAATSTGSRVVLSAGAAGRRVLRPTQSEVPAAAAAAGSSSSCSGSGGNNVAAAGLLRLSPRAAAGMHGGLATVYEWQRPQQQQSSRPWSGGRDGGMGRPPLPGSHLGLLSPRSSSSSGSAQGVRHIRRSLSSSGATGAGGHNQHHGHHAGSRRPGSGGSNSSSRGAGCHSPDSQSRHVSNNAGAAAVSGDGAAAGPAAAGDAAEQCAVRDGVY